jgi:hypothetical protein
VGILKGFQKSVGRVGKHRLARSNRNVNHHRNAQWRLYRDVALSCTVTGPAAALDPPTCAVPTQAAVTGTGAITATLTVYTTGVTASAPTGYVAKAGKPLQRLIAIGGGAVMSALFFSQFRRAAVGGRRFSH